MTYAERRISVQQAKEISSPSKKNKLRLRPRPQPQPELTTVVVDIISSRSIRTGGRIYPAETARREGNQFIGKGKGEEKEEKEIVMSKTAKMAKERKFK